MLSPKPSQTQSESESQNKLVNQNHYLDEYNGRPTLEKIRQLIIQKRATGDLDKRISVTIGWALENQEFFVSQTNFTWANVQNAPKKLYEYEQQMLQAQQKAQLEHLKAQDLLLENTMVYERLNQISEECKQKDAEFQQKMNERNIIKLPISKVKMFLAFCTENDTEDFYVKIDDNGNMQRIVRKPEELL